MILLIVFVFFAASLSLLASLGQLTIKNKRPANYNLWALFFFCALMLCQAGLFFAGILFQYPQLFAFHLTALYLLGIMLYCAFFLVSIRQEPFPDRKFLFFIPSIIAVIFDIIYLTLPRSEQLAIIKSIHLGTYYQYEYFVKSLFLGVAIQSTIYLGSLLIKIGKKWQMGEEVFMIRTTAAYTSFSMLILNFLVTGYLLNIMILYYIVCISIGLMIVGAFLLGQRYPEFLQLIIIRAVSDRYKRSRLEGVETNELHDRLVELMEKEKVFADEEISLSDLADELTITPHQLSQFLNERLSLNFYSFINQYRVKEAMIMLIEEPDRTILSVAHAVGFNSKSSFYDAFSRFTGKTPSQYRKHILGG
ncbi:MAG: AraC family transcriptional regulator [bacterium]|nr:AraC family transcriptional regulator [bacterium]